MALFVMLSFGRVGEGCGGPVPRTLRRWGAVVYFGLCFIACAESTGQWKQATSKPILSACRAKTNNTRLSLSLLFVFVWCAPNESFLF